MVLRSMARVYGLSFLFMLFYDRDEKGMVGHQKALERSNIGRRHYSFQIDDGTHSPKGVLRGGRYCFVSSLKGVGLENKKSLGVRRVDTPPSMNQNSSLFYEYFQSHEPNLSRVSLAYQISGDRARRGKASIG